MKTPLIVFKNVSKQFGAKKVLDKVNLEIFADQVTTIIGKSGSGKSVTLKHIIGLIEPDEGTILFQGKDIMGLSRKERTAIYHGISFMFQNNALFDSMTVFDNVAFPLHQTTHLSRHEIAPRVHAMLKQIDLKGIAEKYPAELSGGMQKKLALACTLIHQPQILLLDEPTTGVDPVSRREFWNILTELHLQGTTIIVSTPYMDEADRCSRVGLMYAGKLIECDTPQNIRDKLEGEMIELQAVDWQSALETVTGLPGIIEVQTYGEALHLLVDSGRQRLPEIEQAMQSANLDYRSLRIAPARMEEAFISLIRRMEA